MSLPRHDEQQFAPFEPRGAGAIVSDAAALRVVLSRTPRWTGRQCSREHWDRQSSLQGFNSTCLICPIGNLVTANLVYQELGSY